MKIQLDKPSLDFKIEDRLLTMGPNAGKGHIKLWVTFVVRSGLKKQWKQRPYKTHLYCTPAEFDRVIDAKNVRDRQLSTDLLTIRRSLNSILVRATNIIDTLGVTDQAAFESYFLSAHSIEDIAGHFESKIEELRTAKPRPKLSSAEKYRTALASLQEFFGKGVVITFDMLTPEKLQEYEDWYTEQPAARGSIEKKSLTSVGINMRCLRHIFKRVIKKGIISPTLFPFGVGAYVIPEGGDDTKKFLDKAEKDLFVSWHHGDDRLNELHDYALFSYYGFGMNMSDLARLRKNKVFNDYLTIDRQKTKGKKKKQKATVIPLHPVMVEIIQRRGKKSLIPDDYVFPILEYSMNEEEIFYRIRQLVDGVNAVLATIAKQYNFAIKPTTYTLRHTFSFNFMELGATTEELQDALAHGSKQTTENYKHGFTLDRKRKYSEGL